ncbi:MAG: exoribonuclease R [Vibrio sp.]
MSRDYTYQCLCMMDKSELTEFSMRILHRLISEETLAELYRCDDEEFEGTEKAQMAHIDAMVKMHAIALGQLPAMFEGSDQANQNIQRMTRLLMWHFYAVAFNLEHSVSLATHCAAVENLISTQPENALAWSKQLTELLYRYAEQ